MTNYPLLKVCDPWSGIYFFYNNSCKGTCFPDQKGGAYPDVWGKKHKHFIPAEMFHPKETLDTVRTKAKEYYVRQTS